MVTAIGFTVYLVVFQLFIWPVLNQAGRPVETLTAILTLTARQGSSYQIAEHTYVVRAGQLPAFLRAKGLLEGAPRGAERVFRQADQTLCALDKPLMPGFSLFTLHPCKA